MIRRSCSGARADRVTAECLDRMCQPVQGVRRQQQTIEQQGIGGNRGIAQASALHRDQKEHQLQRQRAQEDIAVDRQ